MPIVLNNFPEYRPYSNVQPFTVRDGATYLLQLEALKDWLRDYVIPHINTEVTGLSESWVAQTTALIENFEQLSTALIEQVNTATAGVDADAAAAETARLAAEAARDLAAQYASQAEEIQDVAVTGIFNDTASAFRGAVNTLLSGYVTTATHDGLASDVATLETLTGEGRLSETSLADEFEKRNPTVVHIQDKITATGDLTAPIQAVIDTLGNGSTIIFDAGSWRVDGTLNIPQDNITVVLEAGARIDRTLGSAFASCINATGDNFYLTGNGVIESFADWDGTNVAWTYAVVHCNGGSFPKVEGITLLNVPRIGIGFQNNDGTAIAENLTIIGNYPAAEWTEVETVNFGIGYDPGANSALLIAKGNTLRSTVQGICLGNYGIGSSRGSVISNNVFEGCHNHGLYNSGGCDYTLVNGNSFINSRQAIAQTGEGHVVTDNLLIATGTGAALNRVAQIHMRNAIGCVVSGNKIKGDVYPTAPVIDFSHVSGGTVIKNNIVANNQIEITGNLAVGIRMGLTTTVECVNNIIQGNYIRGGGVTNQGAISLMGAAASHGKGNRIVDNNIIVTGPYHGIYVYGNDYADIRGNYIEFQHDAASPSVVGGIFFAGETSKCRARDNDIVVQSMWGANITLRAIYENTGTQLNVIGPNRYDMSTTKLTAAQALFLQSVGGVIVNEELPGVPNVPAAPGSVIRRTDGGTSTTLYVKETANSSAVWRAV